MTGQNRLGAEHSPYLLQHQHNPIWWFPWGEEALTAAREDDKPIFLSIGYATCHWCHVMEGDSFEKPDVAAILNEKFIAIKVDREERPDVDSIYMAAVQAISGHGGWPMSVFLAPDGKPFWAGTFIPRERFKAILLDISRLWTTDRPRVLSAGAQITEHLSRAAGQSRSHAPDAVLTDAPFQMFFRQLLSSFDYKLGGFGPAPKFPPAMAIMTLLRIYRRSGEDKALEMARKTLDAMARGGLYDQLGGGFHRYSTDEHWLVPHFEKMLYDNALLAVAYAEAFQVTKDPDYARITQETLDYILRDMEHADGGYYSAEDADSEKTEGKFYVWHEAELRSLLSNEEYAALERAYGVSVEGNFSTESHVVELEAAAGLKALKNANILCVEFHEKLPNLADPALKSARQKLFETRSKRIRPLRDDKILCGWNGLMIAAMARAGFVLKAPRFLDSARKAADFILKKLTLPDGRLLRRYRAGDARFAANLEDYAFLIHGLVELYQASSEPEYLQAATRLQAMQDQLFSDEISGGYFDTDATDQTLIFRPKDAYDNAVPSGMSVSALNLLRLADLELQDTYRVRAEALLRSAAPQLNQHPRAFPQLLQALDYYLDLSSQIAVAGDPLSPAFNLILDKLREEFLPNSVMALQNPGNNATLLKGREQGEGALAYVCHKNTCQLPTSDPLAVVKLARPVRPLHLAL